MYGHTQTKKHEGGFGSKQCHTLHHHYKCSV
ncbi:hypothetical protein M91_05749 [Bos mutus]|uniref:Uncharacterized protein n=1 Tax=Bos mutus TaxID=72004 RepID=L8IFM0_9CETA|nr:hypothetical protein M91_05749 [Bos mutus]